MHLFLYCILIIWNKYIILYFAHAFLKKLFPHACVMNTTPKPYNKIHLNYILAFIIFIISCVFQLCYQCVKSVIFDLYFPVFGLNTEIYGVGLHIQSECRKTRTRNDSDTWTPTLRLRHLDTFYAVYFS